MVTSLPFAVLRERSKIAPRALATDAASSEAFSRAIRTHPPDAAPAR
jgi:hypothetical protein